MAFCSGVFVVHSGAFWCFLVVRGVKSTTKKEPDRIRLFKLF